MNRAVFLAAALGALACASDGLSARERPLRHGSHGDRADVAPSPAARKDALGEPLPAGATARLGTLRWRHPPLARAVAFAGNGRVVSAGDGLLSFAAPSGKRGVRAGRAGREFAEVVASVDGKRALGATAEGEVVLVDLASGAELGRVQSPGGHVAAMGFGTTAGRAKEKPRGTRQSTAGAGSGRPGVALVVWSGGTARWLDAKGTPTGERFALVPPVRAAAVAADGKSLAVSCGGGTLELRDTRTGDVLRTFDAEGWRAVTALAVSGDGARVACATEGDLKVLNTRDASVSASRETTASDAGRVDHVAFSGDGTRLAVTGAKGAVRLYSATLEPKLTLEAGKPGTPRGKTVFALAPGGASLATAGDGVVVRLWDARSGKELGAQPGHRGAIECVGFAPGASLVATAGADGTIRLWSAASGEERQVVPAGSAPALGLGFLADGLLVAWTPEEGTLVVRDVASGARIGTIADVPAPPPAPDPAVTIPPDSEPEVGTASEPAFTGLVGGVVAHVAALWPELVALPPALCDAGGRISAALGGDAHALAALGVAERRAHPRAAPPTALASESGLLALGLENSLRLHDVRTGGLVRQVTLGAQITALAFTPDGGLLMIGDAAGKVTLLEVATGRKRMEIRASKDPTERTIRGVAVGADGQSLAWVSAYGTVGVGRLWSMDVERFPGGQAGGALALALSPNGRWLATAGADGVRIFEYATRQAVAHLTGHDGDVGGVAFSADSRLLASFGADGTAVLWNAVRFEELVH